MSASTSVPQAGRPRPNPEPCDSAMLEALLAQAPVGFAFIDPDLRLRRVSSSLAEMTGGTLADQLGHVLDRVWPPAVAATAESAVRSVLATGRPVLNRITSAEVMQGAADAAGGPAADRGATDHIPAPRPGVASDAVAANGNGQADGAASRKLALSWYPAQNQAGATTGVTMIAVDVTASS